MRALCALVKVGYQYLEFLIAFYKNPAPSIIVDFSLTEVEFDDLTIELCSGNRFARMLTSASKLVGNNSQFRTPISPEEDYHAHSNRFRYSVRSAG
jgi:hypothetical protein